MSTFAPLAFSETVKKVIKMEKSRTMDDKQALTLAVKEFLENPAQFLVQEGVYKKCKVLKKNASVYKNQKQPEDIINDSWNITLNVSCEISDKTVNTSGRQQVKDNDQNSDGKTLSPANSNK